MFLQTGGGGKGIRPNQHQQQQHHNQSHHQSHHQTHHPHAQQQQQQQQQPQPPSVHHGHPAPQQTHSHHPHQQHQQQHPHQQHQQHQQQSQQQQQQAQHHHPPPVAYYSFQLSQAQPPPPAQHAQPTNNAAVTATQMAPSPPTQTNAAGATSSVSAAQSHSMVGGGGGGMSGGGSSASATNIARQHAAAAAVAAAAAAANSGANMQHYTSGTALMPSPATSTAFMTTAYLQQYHQQSAAVIAAAAAAAQYNNNAAAAAAAAANNHSGPGGTATASAALYQQQQQQHHQALHHTQASLHTHYYHAGAGAAPTPPPHLHPHHHPQQHQLRGVLTAQPHQRQPQTTYLVPANAIFALPPSPMAASPRTSLLTAGAHQQTGSTASGMPVTPLMQSGARAAAGGPTAYITSPFCQPPLPMGAAGMTPPQPLLATPSTNMQHYTSGTALMPCGAAASNSSSTSSLTTAGGGGSAGGATGTSGSSTGGTETVKPRKYAIPIIHPITHENILDPKPQKKSTAVEAKPSGTDAAAVSQDPTDKSITVSISRTPSFTTMTAATPKEQHSGENVSVTAGAGIIAVQREKIDQQMQTDAVRDRSTCRRVSTYDARATDCSPLVTAVSGDEDNETFGYGDPKDGRSCDVNVLCTQMGAYLNEEEQQMSLGDDHSAAHVTASIHSATGDDGDGSNYDEESTSLMLDVAENEQDNLELADVYGAAQDIQQLHFCGSDADNKFAHEQYEESDISAVTSATTLSGGEEDHSKSDFIQPLEQRSSVTVTPVQTGQRSKFAQTQNVATTTTTAGNDVLRAIAGAESVTATPAGNYADASAAAQTATSFTNTQLKSSKSNTSASSAAVSIASGVAPTTITTSSKTTTQKTSPITSGASSSATSTPTHHSYAQPQQMQRQQYQHQQQQQQQQRKTSINVHTVGGAMTASISSGSSGGGASASSSLPMTQSGAAANTKKGRKASKRAKESQKKLHKQSEVSSQRFNAATLSSSNNNNSISNSSGSNSNNNKSILNNANTNNLNNNLATKNLTTTTTTATSSNILTDINNANSSSDSGNLRETTTTSTANLRQQQQQQQQQQQPHPHQSALQQRSSSVTKSASLTCGLPTKTNTKSDSLTDIHQSTDRTSHLQTLPQPQQQQLQPTKHLKTQEIVAQFLQSSSEQQLQFLNSSSSACEDEEEMCARLQMQMQQDAAEAASSMQDVKFGDFAEDKDCQGTASSSPSPTPVLLQQQQQQPLQRRQSTKSNSPHKEINRNKSATTKDTVDCTQNVSTTTLTKTSSASSGRVGKKTTTASTANSAAPIAASPDSAVGPPKPRKYSLDELKALSKSSEARKPPMVSCQRGDCISQLFVSRQQHHHLTHHAHNMSSLALHQHLQQQQYQHMNFNESMELVSGKRGRSGQTKKHHEHQSGGGGAVSGVLSVAAAGGGGGGAGAVGQGGIGNAAGVMSAQQQRKVDFIRVQLSLKEEIKLSECENAWQPETLRSKSNNVSPSGANDDIDAVLKRVRGVLNKLTPDNFDVLLKSMTSISMNTQEKMQQVMLLIFEKTVSEPNFAPTYAKFCKVLFQEIKAESKSLFSSSLINRIQTEFETNVNDANAKKLKLQPLVDKLENCVDSKERLELQAELEDQEYQFRRRAWGTVRFIGEMFKLQSLTNDRVFLCIESLLEHGSEEKLEYMCKLLTTVGHLLESPEHTSNARMDKIFRRIHEIIHKSRSNKSGGHFKISSRVRFMMQDVMDLRARTWDHPQSQTQQQHQHQMLPQQQLQQSSQRRSAISAKQDDKTQAGVGSSMYEKNNRLGNYGGGGGSVGGGGNQGNQRHLYQKSHKSWQQHEQQKLNIDVNKLKFASDEVMQGTTKLGSSKQYLWRTSGRQTTASTITSGNQPVTLLNMNTSGANTVANSGGFKRQSSMLGVTTGMSTVSAMANNPFQALDRQEKSNDLHMGASSPQELQKGTQFSMEPADMPDLSKKECQKLLNQLIEELLAAVSSRSSNGWQQETVNEWNSLNTCQQKSLLNYLLSDYLYLQTVKRAHRKACAAIFVHLMRAKMCGPQIFTEVYTELADELRELLIDVPNLWTYVFEFIGPLLHEQLLHFNDIWLPQWAADSKFTKRFLHALITYFTSEFGTTYTRELWNKEFKLDHGQQFISDSVQWYEFVNFNHFEYIHDRNYKPPQREQSTSTYPAAIAEQVTRIEYLLNTINGCDLAIDYINTNVHINTHFIRSLTKFLCCDYATVMPATTTAHTQTVKSSRELDSELFRHKCIPLLRRCLDGLETHEVACLDAIVDAMQEVYETPTANQLICSIFDLIYDSEVIPKESFDKWYRAVQSSDSVTDSKDAGMTKALTTKKASATLAVSSFSSRDSSGAARLNEDLHAYMEKLL